MAQGFRPRQHPDGSVLVSPQQMQIHRSTELLSFTLGTPLLLWAASPA